MSIAFALQGNESNQGLAETQANFYLHGTKDQLW